jgi:hypothetical protein
MIANQQTKNEQVVVRPHSVEKMDVSDSVMRMLTQTAELNRPRTVMIKDLDKQARIYVKLVYTDWSHEHAETGIREFEFLYRPGDDDITIRSPLQPSHIHPSI